MAMANNMDGMPYNNASLYHRNSHMVPDCNSMQTMLNMAAQNAAQNAVHIIFGSNGSGMYDENSGYVWDGNFSWNDGGINGSNGGTIKQDVEHNVGGNI
eukprot:10174160-Ditylum_brightwellii.AAC.1